MSPRIAKPKPEPQLEVGDQVAYWRRDKGSTKSEYVTAEVVEVIRDDSGRITRCIIQRDDTKQERNIDALRLKVIKLAPPPPEEEAPF